MDWLLDSMIQGNLQDYNRYLVDTTVVKRLIEREPKKAELKK